MIFQPAWAAAWEVVPTLSVAEFYTDNVGLQPAASARSAWVTQLRPGISASYNGPNLKFTAGYTAEVLYHSHLEDVSVRHQFSGTTLGSVELVPQFLFLDTSSNVAQQNVSALGPQQLDNINTTSNRATVRTTIVSPYIRYNFGSEVRSELRYAYSTVSTDGEGANNVLSDSGGSRISARLASGPAYKLTTWSLAYNRETVDYDNNQETTLQNVAATVRRLITPFVGLQATLGHDDNDYPTTVGPQPKGRYWNVGIDWEPTPRTNFSATTGRRYFGSNHSLAFSHRTRLTVWNVSYSEEITTTRGQFVNPTTVDTATQVGTVFQNQFPDPIARQQAVRQFITQTGLPPTLIAPVNFYSNQTILVKGWQASAGLLGVRHTVMANVFLRESTTQTPGLADGAGDFGASSSVTQNGAGLLWNWRITPVTASNLNLSFTRSEFPGAAREDDQRYAQLGVNHQFSPKLSGALNFRRQHGESSQAGAGYTENSVMAQLQMRF